MSLRGSQTGKEPDAPPGIDRTEDQPTRAHGNAWQVLRQAWRLPGRLTAGAFQDVVTTMFPGDCRLCGGPLLSLREGIVCEACTARASRRQEGLLCIVCGEALGLEGERAWRQFGTVADAPECTPCRRVRPAFARAVAWGLYDDELRELLQGLKYSPAMERASAVLGPLLAEAILLLESHAAREVVVVPVPLARRRRRERGFNQVDHLLDVALPEIQRRAPSWQLAVERDVMVRERDTESQYGLTPRQRRTNVRGAFAVRHPERVRGREVMLVDDIYTTGATARECARVLVAAGAAKVWVATLSRAQAERAAVWEGDAAEVARWDAG